MVKQRFARFGHFPFHWHGLTHAQPPAIAPQTTPRRRSRRGKPRPPGPRKPVRWSLVYLALLCLSGGMGTVAFLWLASLPPLPDCQNISLLSADADRLYCAREAARSGEPSQLLAGLTLVESWSEGHPLYAESQRLAQAWSQAMLAIAQEQFDQNDFTGAVALARQIPSSSPLYAEAQQAIADWHQEWHQGEAILAVAEAAIKAQDWNRASAQVIELGKLKSRDDNQQRLDTLANRILVEKAEWQTLNRARNLAKDNQPEQLGQAIAISQQVKSHTYAGEAAKADIQHWGKTLLALARQRWQQGDLAAATQLVKAIPPQLPLNAQAQDFLRYHQAQLLATLADDQWQPSLKQIWGLSEAIAAVRQIQPDSEFHAQAQADLEKWQGQLDDLTQLQVAHVVASVGSRATLEMAVEWANQISSDRPRRMQAQTLVAHWQLEIQRLEDRPYLSHAQTLAKPRTIPALREAIAQAQVIPLGRALRVEAQTWIAHWQLEIERIEDQPMLDRARTLAAQGKLSAAIQEARQIKSGRALYEEAQSAMTRWRNQIREALIAEDQPILNDAYALAEQGRLSQAIDRAAEIGSGRPLSGEASAAIAQWRIERQAIWDQWATESAPIEDYNNSAANEPSVDSYDGYYDPGYEP